MRRLTRAAAYAAVLAFLGTLTLPIAVTAADTDTFTIATVQDFANFARGCTRDVWSQDLTVELIADLDLSGTNAAPVPIFQGTFHGNGHTISGLSFQEKGSKVGLFRTLTECAVVEDLNVEGTLEPQGSASQVGLLAGENHGTVRRCSVQGSVIGQEDVGGLVGQNGENGRLTGCSSSATVTGVNNVGGLVGQNLGIVEECSNRGEMNTQPDQETPTSVGGIAGLSRGTIRNCTNSGAVGYQHVGYNMGGIVGLQSGEVSGCVNTAAIKGRKDVGGIVGQFEPNTSLTYGQSPTQQLTESLADLFSQLERFTNQINGMVTSGVDDVQAIHDSLSAIQERTYAVGTEGREDFRAMSDSLYQHTSAISGSLDELGEDLEWFTDEAEDQIQEALDQSKDLLTGLGDLADGADSGLGQAIHALENTVFNVRTQLQIIRTHRQAMERELDTWKQYVSDVARLIADGAFEQALQLPVPSTDLVGHWEASAQALEEIARLALQLPSQWSDIYDRTSHHVGQAEEDIDRAIDRLYDALTALNRAGGNFSDLAQQDIEAVGKEADRIRDLLKEYTDTLGDQAQAAVDDIDRELTAIQDRVDSMTQSVQEDNQALHATSQDILDQMEAVRQAISGLGEEPELTVTDLTDELEEGPGLIKGCRASGTVEGDSNVGGIVGTVASELGDDPEATFDLGDLKLMSDVYATLRAVVRDCRFDGAVTAKNDSGGGVAGRCEAGAILDCVARGTVETGGDYCGGIAGRTRGRVERCAALVDLKGQSWLGGVAGLGQDMTDCRTMVRANSSGEYLGAIAGQAEGELNGNRYLMEDLAGLDGVDYAQSAQGMEFEAFSQLEYIPEDFLTFSYRFEVNGQTVAEIPFTYGGDLDMSQVPEAPQQDGQYGQWPRFPTQNLRRSLILQVQFTMPTSTLADEEGVAQLLVEGNFSPEAVLTVEQGELPKQGVKGYTARSVWNYSVTGSQSDTLTVRLRAEGVKKPAVAVYRDGSWERVDSVLDGSYLVFSGPVQGTILLLEAETPIVVIAALAIGGIGAVCLLLSVISRKKRACKAAKAAKEG